MSLSPGGAVLAGLKSEGDLRGRLDGALNVFDWSDACCLVTKETG